MTEDKTLTKKTKKKKKNIRTDRQNKKRHF